MSRSAAAEWSARHGLRLPTRATRQLALLANLRTGHIPNRPPVTPRYHQQMPGRYLFVLTSSFDAAKVRDVV